MGLSSDITGYVALAFEKADDLVKLLTLSSVVKGTFDPATGLYPTTASTYTVEVIDDDDNSKILQSNFTNKNVRSYVVKAGTLAVTGQKFTDDGLEWTVFRVSKIAQNSTLFVYTMWAEA